MADDAFTTVVSKQAHADRLGVENGLISLATALKRTANITYKDREHAYNMTHHNDSTAPATSPLAERLQANKI